MGITSAEDSTSDRRKKGNQVTADQWTVAEAKAKLSELIERTRADGPQTITRHGKAAVVLVSAEEWARKTRRTGNLADFLAASPLRDSGLEVEREPDGVREVEL